MEATNRGILRKAVRRQAPLLWWRGVAAFRVLPPIILRSIFLRWLQCRRLLKVFVFRVIGLDGLCGYFILLPINALNIPICNP